MHDVDFLPERFREQSAHRRARNHSFVVVAMFAVLLVLGAWGQRRVWNRLSVEARIAHTAFEQTAEQARAVAALQEDLVRIDRTADLLTFLQHPWPRSQILATVLSPVPDSISIDRFQVSREALEAVKPANVFLSGVAPLQPPNPGTIPAERDLTRLREEIHATRITVRLQGRTRDQSELHAYLHELLQNELVERSELVSLEQNTNEADEAVFVARLIIQPGYGLPGGPDSPTPTAEQVARISP